jgi:hypothetical protein
MLAVTIGVGRCASLAIEAANRCRQFTGLDVVILNEAHQRRYRVAEPHHLKFHLFDILPDVDRLLYFDADLWFVAGWSPTEFPSLSAVRDNELYEGMRRECDRFGLAPDRYFNSGLLIIERQHAGMFRTAERLLHQHGPSSIWRDQTWLNLAAKECGTPVQLIHRAYNTFPIPHDGEAPVVGAHGAGTDATFDSMMRAVSQLRRRCLPTTLQDADQLYQYTVHGVGSHRLLLRADGTIGLGAAQLERYWYLADDRLVLCSWTEDAVHLREQRPGVWQGKWLGFGKHDVTLELHRAQSIVDALQSRGGERLVGAEVGVWHGETSEYLLLSLPHLNLHMVDRWQEYPPNATPSSLKQASQGAFDAARQRAIQATEFAVDRRTIHRQASVQAAASFDNGSLDFVVIDAEHGFESVVADITVWLPKLKPGGILFGHDYGHPRFPGVKRAFDELLPGPLTLTPDYLVFQRKEAA